MPTRWPAAFFAALVAYSLIYAYAPDVEPRKLAWLSPGAIVAVVVWLAGSAGFGLFLKASPGYGAAYGAFTAAIDTSVPSVANGSPPACQIIEVAKPASPVSLVMYASGLAAWIALAAS